MSSYLAERRNSIPFIYTRGTHYQVGFDIGRTFKSMIENFLNIFEPLNQTHLPLYDTAEGKDVYKLILNCVTKNFPQYIEEMKGTADGASVPFHKLFLLHLDEIFPNMLQGVNGENLTYGCTTICCNQPNQAFIGHTEDTSPEILNHFYMVSAHIIDKDPEGRWHTVDERFTSLCYAGHLPGFTMSYNFHGMISTVNIINISTTPRTPRFFLCRALLAAKDITDVENILKDKGCGAADGFCVNLTFLNAIGNRQFYNIEVGPATYDKAESVLDILCASPGQYIYHCNKYLRLKMEQVKGLSNESSTRRQIAIERLKSPASKLDMISILSDQSDREFTIFRDAKWEKANSSRDNGTTVVVGIFDCVQRIWEIYTDNPASNEPLVTIPLLTGK